MSNKGQPGSAWSPEEVTRTKERIWKILINPKKFVSKSKRTATVVLTAGKTAMPLTRVGTIRSAPIAMRSSVPPSIPSVSVAEAGQ